MLPGCPASHLSAGYPPARVATSDPPGWAPLIRSDGYHTPARVGTPEPNDTSVSSRAEGSIPSVRRERFHPFEWTLRPLLFKGGDPLAHGVIRGAAPPLNPRLFVGRFFFFFIEKKKKSPLRPQKKKKCDQRGVPFGNPVYRRGS